MPTYILLNTLSSGGARTVVNNPERIKEVNAEIEALGACVVAQWATFGRYDFVNVVEAPDDMTMARVSFDLAARGTGRFETLPAIATEDLIKWL